MTVLDRGELQESPLADLHLIADQIGLEGFRRLRKADLIDAILADQGVAPDDGGREGPEEPSGRRSRSRRGRSGRPRSADAPAERTLAAGGEPDGEMSGARRAPVRGGRERPAPSEQVAEGVVEILGNGSAFLRVEGPEPSDEDVYVSAAQVRRCELVSGDRVGGPVRSPRRSERYPSLIRIETINGEPADSVSQGTRYEDLPVAWPTERIELGSGDPTLEAIESLAPFGRGSRVVIVGGARSGKTETLRRIFGAVAASENIEQVLVLSGVRPEEPADWQGPVAPLAVTSLAASPDAQGQAVEGIVENAKRIAVRGGDAVVLIDTLDGLHPHTARRVLAAARNLSSGGSLTVIATATRPFGGETTVIALDSLRTSTNQTPALDLLTSGTLKAELLVGEEGAEAMIQARANAAAAAAADK